MSQAVSSLDEGIAGLSRSGREMNDNTVVRGWSYVKETFKLGHTEKDWFVLGLWFISFSLDPLFYYGFWIDDEENIFEYSKMFAAPLVTVNVVSLIIKYTISVRQLATTSLAKNLRVVKFTDILGLMLTYVLPALFIYQPIKAFHPLVLLAVMTTHVIFYSWRISEIYRLFTEAIKTSRILAEAIQIKIVFNLVLYLYGGHVIGSLWYLFAVGRMLGCWNQACIVHSGCYMINGRFIDVSGHNYYLNELCSTDDQGTYDFGIFKDAIESGIVHERNIGKKLLYCFTWGLQNLSGFGQNLDISRYGGENIFVIFITIYSMVTFIYFIGNMQTYLKCATKRSKAKEQKEEEKKRKEDKIRRKLQEVEQWFHFRKLSIELQNCIKNHQKSEWQQDGAVDLENWLTNLPRDIQKNIKRELCLELLKKVEEFGNWSEALLVHLCDYAKVVVHAERTRIVCEGDPIDEMLFVLQGKLWTYSKGRTIDSKNNVPCQKRKDHLKDGDFWGEQLVNWVLDGSSSINIPISNETIQALTKVEVFVLGANDLKYSLILYQNIQFIQSLYHYRRIMLPRSAQTSIQDKAPSAESTGTQIIVEGQ